MRWASHVARVGKYRNVHKVLVENVMDKITLKTGTKGKILLKRISQK